MRRLLPLFLFIFSISGFALSQSGRSNNGTLVLAFGKVRQPDGSYKSVKGIKLPITIEQVNPPAGDVIPPFSKIRPPRGGDQSVATAYLNDNGGGTYHRSGVEFPMPSALDDIVLSTAGNGVPWQSHMTGYAVPDRSTVLLRFQVFNTFNGPLGPGVSAFSGLLADYGGYLDTSNTTQFPNIPGDYKVTVNGISVLGIAVNDGECYFAQQIRQPHVVGFPPQEDGEGAFRFDWFMIFGGGGVTVGSSADIFWYDADPVPNGLYEDPNEKDFFGGPPTEANFLCQINVAGTAQELFPFSVTQIFGRNTGGNFVDLWNSDNTYYVADSFNTSGDSPYPIVMRIESQSPVTNITSMKFTLESRGIASGFEQSISLFNFVTNQWVQLHSSLTTTVDKTVEAFVLSNPAQFVRTSDRRVMALIKYRENIAEIVPPWWVRLDKATWTVVRP